MPCHALPCLAMSCLAMPCHVMPCHVMPCHALPCHALPCHALTCLAMPCHALPCLSFGMARHGKAWPMRRRGDLTLPPSRGRGRGPSETRLKWTFTTLRRQTGAFPRALAHPAEESMGSLPPERGYFPLRRGQDADSAYHRLI
jgi:hypothetical protein